MKRAIIAGVFLLALIVMAVVLNKSYSAQALNVGKTDGLIGASSDGQIFFINKGSLLSYTSKSIQTVASGVTDARLSNDGSHLMYFVGDGDKATITSREISSGNETKYTGYLNAFWYQNDPYFTRQKDNGFMVYDKTGNAIGGPWASDYAVQIGDNLFTADTATSPEEEGAKYKILSSGNGRVIATTVVDSDSETWSSPSNLFYISSDAYLHAITSAGEDNNTKLQNISANQITKLSGNTQYFVTAENIKNQDVFTINKLDIAAQKVSKVASIPQTEFKVDPSATPSITGLVFANGTLYIQTQEDVWGVKI